MRFLQWFVGSLLLVALTFGIAMDAPDEIEAQQVQQCEMWEIWHADRRAGVPIEKRYGWPDVCGRYYEECDQ